MTNTVMNPFPSFLAMTVLGPYNANLNGKQTPYSERIEMHSFWLLLPQLTERQPQRFSKYLNIDGHSLASLCCYLSQFKNWFLIINWLDISFVSVYALVLPSGHQHSQLL